MARSIKQQTIRNTGLTKYPLQWVNKATDIAPLVPIPNSLAAPLPLQSSTATTSAPLALLTLVDLVNLVKSCLAQRAGVLLIRPLFDTAEAEGVGAYVYGGEVVGGGYVEAYAARLGRRGLVVLRLVPLELFVARFGYYGRFAFRPGRFGGWFGIVVVLVINIVVVLFAAPPAHAVCGQRRGDAVQSPDCRLAT